MVHEASGNISSAVQEVGLAISNAVEKSRTESFFSADEDTSSMLLDDALQDLSESTTAPIGDRGATWRRLSDLETFGDGNVDTENILNVMSAIGSLKLLQQLAADSEFLTDAVGRVSMAAEQLRSRTPTADETAAPTPLEVRAVCGTLLASIDELTSTVRDLVSDAGCSELDSSLISKIEDYKDTLLTAIDKSNDVRSDAVERMKGLEDKIVVTEKTVEFKDALGELLNAVECALVERGPGSDAVVNLQAASCRHAAAKMVTAVTGVTGDRVLPERAQETIEANIATVAREAVAVTAHMRGSVPFAELLAVHPPLQERVNELRHIEQQTLSAPGALAEAAETTPVSEFNELFLGSEHRRDPRRRPRWTSRLQDKTTMAGTRVRLSCTCATDDDVSVEVDWYLNGALLRPESDQRLRAWLAADGAASLEISDVGLQDGGEYTCTARNMHGRASCTADLHVRAGAIEPRPGPPTFLTGLRVSYILEDDVLIIECQLAGHPAPRVTWLRDGAAVASSDRVHQTQADDGVCKLLVQSPQGGDDGKYTCLAENRVGSAEISEHITVPGGAQPRPAGSPERPARSAHTASRPVFLDALRDVEASQGRDLDLKVKVAAAAGHRRVTSPTYPERPSVTSERPAVTSAALERLARCAAPAHYHCPPAWRRLGMLRPRVVYLSRRHYRTGTWPGLAFSIAEYYPNRHLRARLRELGSPSPDISWLHNGQPVRPSARLRAWGRFPDYALSLHSLTAGDAGTYTCRAANAHGAATCSASVSLGAAGAGQPARIVEKPDDLIRVANGGDLLLTCRIAGEPRPKVAFHKGRQNLLASRRATLEVAGELCHLRMERLHFSDSGTYCVEAQNADGADRCYVLVRVKEPNRAQTPDWDSRTSSRLMASADLRRTQRFTQDVPGPLPGRPYTRDVGQNWVSLAWPRPLYNGGAPILSYKVEAWLKCEDAMWDMVGMSVICSMDIFDLKPDRTYIFRVTPRNRYGWGEGSCSLPVLVGRERVAPRFGRLLPATIKCLLGDCLELQCQVSGEPAPEVVWLRDGIPLPSGLCRLRVAHQGDLCRLSVSAVRPSDQATYTCQAVNTAGQASTFTRLTVVERELLLRADRAINSALESAAAAADRSPSEPLAPYFLVRPRERRVAVGSSVRLTCQVTGHPLPEVTWAKDGVPLQQNERFAMWHEAHHFHTLEITAARFDELGTYSAVASNEHGDITCSCTLVVDRGHLLYAGPELVRSLPEVTRVSATAGLELQARCTAYPAISVLWHRDGRRVRIARRQTLSLDGNGLATLRIGSASHGDAGNYSCTMSNEMGSVVTATRLVVQDSPDGPVEAPCFVRDPVSSHVLEGDSVTVTCEVVGDPAPEVTWRRQEPAQRGGDLPRSWCTATAPMW
ncbi:Muscle M-line assembly protein unc-89 [Amphibalanus amphitrite]|uniref:Muscle M-line assembly protein unc-89 n=1 Tax=Amphibalanus amphitrite TaxID=1232801 RepID=A0A6A4W6D9_AMPAM|nr:Muscle M-line assembly protein unc-89 [Amphibalanus amphitrite]